jgi:hypothetical protein
VRAGDTAGTLVEALLRRLPEDVPAARQVLARVTDWAGLVAAAERHGVAGLLHDVALGPGAAPGRVPPAAGARLRHRRAAERLWHARLAAALDRGLRALDGAGVRALALKGPVLGERLYEDPAVRPSADLDLLVAPGALDRAIAELEALGYRAETGPSAAYARRHHHHLALHHPREPAIELHFRACAGFGAVIPAEALLARATPHRTRGGAPAWVAAPADEALYLLVHAARHRFERLLWLHDVKLLVARHGDLDWGAIAARARGLELGTALACAVSALRTRLGVAVPAALDGGALGARARRAGRLLPTLAAGRPLPRPVAALGELGWQALLCDRPGATAALLRHHLARMARRLGHRRLPWLVPAGWAA